LPEVEGVIALSRAAIGGESGPSDNVAPYLFQRPEELETLALWPKMPVPSVLRLIQKAHPEAKLAVVCRGCEERGIVEMAKHDQVSLDNVTLIGLQCVTDEATFCRCAKPYTTHAQVTVGERIEGVPDPLTDELAAKSLEEKLAFWKEQFLHCIKCYGCRNACPQCFCNVCALEDEKWVETGLLPMPMPSMYHLVRAMHMTAKCVACRECEETCPADIPMAILYRLIARDVQEMFGYETGAVIDQLPPQLLVLEEGDYARTGLP
jgi:formate dehydrogenase subunit beta